MERLLDSREIVVDRADAARRALRLYRTTTADMADCPIERLGAEDGCETTLTHDARAARDSGVTLLEPAP